MSKTLLTCVSAYLQSSLIKELDEVRGDIPRSKIVERAIVRYLDDVKSGEERLLPKLDKIMLEVQNTTK
jgi:metal-responsive CopG/Arc/MetJ family transcriptional regulator